MLDKFANNPEEWYRKYILGKWPEKGQTDLEKRAAVGTAVHTAAQHYGNARILNDAFSDDFVTSYDGSKNIVENAKRMTFEEIFWDQLRRSGAFSEQELADSNFMSDEFKGRVARAVAFVNKLPEMFRDEEVLAVEKRIQLPFGNKRLPSGQGYKEEALNTIGFIDVQTRKKNPDGSSNPNNPIINTEFKAKSTDSGALPQLGMYS